MAARENQAQPIIFKGVFFIGVFPRSGLRFEMPRELVLRGIASCPAPQGINSFESSCRNQPGSRVIGYSTRRPRDQRSCKGVVHGLLSEIKITEQADQSRQNPS